MHPVKVKSGEARAKWRDILDQVFAGKGDIVIERNGKDIVAIIPAEDYKQIREMLQNIRAVRENAAAYKTLKTRSVQVNSEEGTAIIPLEAYEKLIAERDARFEIIERIQSLQPDISPEEVEKDVAEAIAQVRGQDAESGH